MTDLSPMMKILGMPATIKQNNLLHNQRIGKVILKSDKVSKEFIFYALLIPCVNDRIKQEATGSTVKHTSPTRILNTQIPLPPLEIQNAIVEKLEKERAAIEACKTLIAIFEDKIKTKIAEVWGQ